MARKLSRDVTDWERHRTVTKDAAFPSTATTAPLAVSTFSVARYVNSFSSYIHAFVVSFNLKLMYTIHKDYDPTYVKKHRMYEGGLNRFSLQLNRKYILYNKKRNMPT